MMEITIVTQTYPNRDIPLVVSPSRETIEEVLRSPQIFGDIGRIGGLQLDVENEIAGDSVSNRISLSNPPFSVYLQFYLGEPGYAMLFYTHTGKAIYEMVIGPGTSFESEKFTAFDLGATDTELNKINLLTIDEALDVAISFVESEGELGVCSIDGSLLQVKGLHEPPKELS